MALIGHERLCAHLGLVVNRIADDEVPRELATAVRESLLGLLSEQTSLSHPSIGDLWRAVCDGWLRPGAAHPADRGVRGAARQAPGGAPATR